MICHPQFSTVLRLLLVLLVVFTVRSDSFDGTNSTLKSVFKRGLEHVESVKTGDDRYCDHEGYFNPLRWEESEAGPAYMEWTMLLDKSSKAWQERVSEANFFTRDVLDWADIDCGITYKGCVRMPTCDYILAKIGDEKSARQIYFILLSMNNINLISGVVNEQSLAAQVNVASLSSNMANTFFWKHSDSLDAKCKQESAIIKGVISSLLNAVMVVTPLMAAPFVVGEEVAVALKAAEEAEELAVTTVKTAENVAAREMGYIAQRQTELEHYAEEAETSLQQMQRLEAEMGGNPENRLALENALIRARESYEHASLTMGESQKLMDEAKHEADVAKHEAVLARTFAAKKQAKAITKKTDERLTVKAPPWSFDRLYRKAWRGYHKFTTGKPSAIPFGLVGMPVAIEGNQLDVSWCALSPNPTVEAEHGHEMDLDKNIEKAGVKFREQVQSDMAHINKGVGFEDDGGFSLLGESVLADQMFDGQYVTLSADDHLRFVEEPFRIEKDITTHFKNAVISEILKEELCYLHCTRSDSGFSKSSSRFEPVPGTMCQAQCWRNWKVGKTVEMYGLESLVKPDNDWDLDMRDFVLKSFRHWQEYRYDQTGPNLFPTIGELFTGDLTSSSGSYLPVCYSESMTPQDFTKKGKDERLPCICGDAVGNETMLFFKEAGFEKWTANKNGKGLAMACQWSMSQQKVPPVQTFLSLCHYGWHFPLWHEKNFELQHGRDDMCDDMEIEQFDLMQRGWDEGRINCHICFTSAVGRAVAASQRISWQFSNEVQDFYSFQSACHTFDSNPHTSCLY